MSIDTTHPRIRQLLWVLLAVGVALLVISVVVSVMISASNSEVVRQNTEIIKESQETNRKTLHLVEDCVTPGRHCYTQGQARTGQAVASINQVSVAAAICADKPKQQTAKQIEECVRKRLVAQASAP